MLFKYVIIVFSWTRRKTCQC